MLDSIQVGASGLQSFSQGLRMIANNTTNLHTAGFRSALLQFSEAGGGSGESAAVPGHGVAAPRSRLDFSHGELGATGRSSDLGLDGEGWFVLRDAQGELRYTRSGAFQVNADGHLVSQEGLEVMGLADGRQEAISLAGRNTVAATPTSTLTLTGNLSSTEASQTVAGLKVIDAAGREHALSLRLTSNASQTPGNWKLELLESDVVVGTGNLQFQDGHPDAASARIALNYTPSAGPVQPLVLALGADVTSFAAGSLSTLAMLSQDGRAPGTLTQSMFDAKGVLKLTYSNGRTVDGPTLLLARMRGGDGLVSVGSGLFKADAQTPVIQGSAGQPGFGTVRTGVLEGSNVDLSREFSELVIVQRGYQASSQVIATANDMLQELFNMKKQ